MTITEGFSVTFIASDFVDGKRRKWTCKRKHVPSMGFTSISMNGAYKVPVSNVEFDITNQKYIAYLEHRGTHPFDDKKMLSSGWKLEMGNLTDNKDPSMVGIWNTTDCNVDVSEIPADGSICPYNKIYIHDKTKGDSIVVRVYEGGGIAAAFYPKHEPLSPRTLAID